MEYYQVEIGFKFPSKSYTLDSSMVSDYLKAVQETNPLYCEQDIVPPMAVTAYAMAASSEGISFPPGTIHVSQDLEFSGVVKVGDTITCHAKVSRKQQRGGLFLMATDIEVFNQYQEKVLTGKVGFVLPEQNKGKN